MMMTLTMAGKRISTETTNRTIAFIGMDLLTPEKNDQNSDLRSILHITKIWNG
jgi:hypothetical protein